MSTGWHMDYLTWLSPWSLNCQRQPCLTSYIGFVPLSWVNFPTLAQDAEVGPGFFHFANRPVFSHCVGAIDRCHMHIKASHSRDAQDYVNRKRTYLFVTLLQCIIPGHQEIVQCSSGSATHQLVTSLRGMEDTHVCQRGIFSKAFTPNVVAVCAVLHNICITARDIVESAEEEEPELCSLMFCLSSGGGGTL